MRGDPRCAYITATSLVKMFSSMRFQMTAEDVDTLTVAMIVDIGVTYGGRPRCSL